MTQFGEASTMTQASTLENDQALQEERVRAENRREFYADFLYSPVEQLEEETQHVEGTYNIQVEQQSTVTGVHSSGWLASFSDLNVRIQKTCCEKAAEVQKMMSVTYQESSAANNETATKKSGWGSSSNRRRDDDDENDDVLDVYHQKKGDTLSLENVQLSHATLPIVAAWVAAASRSMMKSGAPVYEAMKSLPMKVSCMGPAFPGGGSVPPNIAGPNVPVMNPADFANGMNLKMSSLIDPSLVPTAFAKQEATIEQAVTNHVGLLSLSSAVMFIGSIRGLNSMKTAKQGNYMGI